MKQLDVVGTSVSRTDAFDKVTGRARFVADLRVPGMLYGKLLRSTEGHAMIRRIDTSRAEALPGVHAVLTWQNVTQKRYTTCGHPFPFDTPEDTQVLSRHVRYYGEPIAAVAAETPELARQALSLIEVAYDPLPVYVDPEDALADGAVELHEGSGNVAGENEYEIGDVESAFAASAYVVEDELFTPIVTHTPIETHVSLAEPDGNGRVVLHCSTQCPHILRERLAYIFSLRIDQVRIVKCAVGGGFGGKQEPVYEPLNMALALACRRPVLLELTREECIASTRTRHSARIHMKTGLTKDGTMLARQMCIVTNTGAYSSHGHNVVFNMATQFQTLYQTPNLRFTGKSVYTNVPVAGAMRAYGIPQYAFAMESHIDHLARTVGMDPYAFRQKNLIGADDPFAVEHMTRNTFGLPEAMEKGRSAIGYDEILKNGPGAGEIRRGVGMAIFSYGQSCYPHSVELSVARVMLNEDAGATLFVGCTEIGQGNATAMRQIAAEALGVPYEWVNIMEVDTDVSPFDPGAYASRQTYVAGHAVKRAAMACKRDLLTHAAELLARNLERLDTRQGYVIDRETGERLAPMAEIARKLFYTIGKGHAVTHEESFEPRNNMNTYGAAFADVDVDTATGRVEVRRIVTALDCGRLINPKLAMGQLNGGNVMSLGYGTSEQLLIDPKTGRVLNDNLLDYKMPTFADVPELTGIFVETDEPSSAYGNKSLGEPPNIAPAVAIRNAVYQATGVGINRIPLTPERVFTALREAEKEEGRVCTE